MQNIPPTTPELIERLKKILHVTSDGEVADALSINRPSLVMKKARNTSILNEVVALAHHKNLDLNKLLLSGSDQDAAGDDNEHVSLPDNNGTVAPEIRLCKKYLQEMGLDSESLIAIRKTPLHIHIVDTRHNKITETGIYAVSTVNGVFLKSATTRLDGSVIFPSDTPKIPAEHVVKEEVEHLNIIGRSVLVVGPPE